MTGKELAKWRDKLGLTRDELAKQLKTTYTTVYRWEEEERAIPPFLDLAMKTVERELKGKGE